MFGKSLILFFSRAHLGARHSGVEFDIEICSWVFFQLVNNIGCLIPSFAFPLFCLGGFAFSVW